MNAQTYGLRLPLLLMHIPIMALCGCSRTMLASPWCDRPITIDGAVEDWGDQRGALEDEDLILGLLNDDQFLYITVTPNSEVLQRQMMALGFAVWFDPAGGESRPFGIHLSLGLTEYSLLRKSMTGERDLNEMREPFMDSLGSIEIISKGITRRMSVSDATGIAVSAQLLGEVLIYELRIPLATDPEHPYAIEAAAGSTIGLGLETPALDREALREAGTSGGASRGGRAGSKMGGRRGPGGARGGPRDDRAMPERLTYWTRVELSTESCVAAREPH